MQALINKKASGFKVKVTENIYLSPNICKILIECPEIAKNAKPGQFVSIFCENLTLRRPFSISKIVGNIFSIIYNIKGEGTEFIASLKKGSDIDLIGPLGNGFKLENKKTLLLGAGAGVAPMLFLAQALDSKNIEYSMLSGFRSMVEISELNRANSIVVTDDGSSGIKGSVNDYIEKIIESKGIEKIYSCGPTPVLKQAVAVAAKYNIDVEVALEKVFACGIGVCMGCVIEIIEDGIVKNKRICKDGPVFRGESLVW